MSYPTDLDGLRLELDEKRSIATITLDVPEKLNRVSMLARDQLARVFEELGRDDAARVVMIAGAGDRAFSAGGDVAGFLAAEPEVACTRTSPHRSVARNP